MSAGSRRSRLIQRPIEKRAAHPEAVAAAASHNGGSVAFSVSGFPSATSVGLLDSRLGLGVDAQDAEKEADEYRLHA